ncbi:hypothetical protein [Plantactinospora sp. GCM10030261]|uniref:hypothetical protein n=1 Tax=Plantactinospora sp. GCM10030261 TaxID=3273420 RepID=UPI00361A7C41
MINTSQGAKPNSPVKVLADGSVAALRADGAELATAQGGTVEVDVKRWWHARWIRLIDADRDDRDPRVVRFDINKGNRQIAHGVDRVLRPIDLP